MNKTVTLSFVLLLSHSARTAWSQDAADGGVESADDVEVRLEELSRRLEAAEEKAEAGQEENTKLKEQVQELSTRLEMVESEDDMEYEVEGSKFESTFDIYGFLEMDLFYFDVDKDDTAHGLFPSSFSFMFNRLNLYLSSQMTETLSALAELRFTFLPHGYEKSYELDILGMEYERVDNTVTDPFTAEEYPLGGIAIERAHFTWQPFNFLGILVGRFLTPFGIWNVDHGSPVIIPVRPPYLMVRSVIPLAQTGAQVFGRFFPAEKFYFDYAVTVSNGRGPTEAIYDLDNNKALGFRLKGAYEAENMGISLGGYLYWGETTDVVKRLSNLDPVEIEIDQTENYSEIVGSIDLLFTLFGLRLQSEYVRGKVTYDVRPLKTYPVASIENPFREYQPDYIKWCVYGLAAYRFDFETTYGEMGLTPFFVYEYNVFDETNDELYAEVFHWGLNFSPSPFVVLKYESSRVRFPESDIVHEGIWVHSGQVSVSF